MSTSVVPLPAVARPGWLARDLGYLLLGLPLGIASVVISVAGFASGVGTLVIWLGVPLLAGTLAAARGFAGLERRRVEAVTGRPLPPHHYRTAAGSGLGRLARSLLDPQSWRDLLHAVLAFPLRVAGFAIAVAWAAGGLGETLYVLWEWALPRGAGNQTLTELAFDIDSRLADIAFHTAIGLILLLTLRSAASRCCRRASRAGCSPTRRPRCAPAPPSSPRAVAPPPPPRHRRCDAWSATSTTARSSASSASRWTSKRRSAASTTAPTAPAEALEQSREALAELRALSRGIAPPILVDRGLGAALAAAAARCPVPVSLDVDLDGRLPDVVEQTAYFVVVEALTNVAKHSGATQVAVTVDSDGERVRVRVTDDGRGGAHAGKGHGLAGLADRIAAAEGWFDLHNPPGGPTLVTAGIPLTGPG